MAASKKRYWSAVFYPESLPDDWKEQLTLTGLPIAISPLHDRDSNPTGEHKKEHYHILMCYPGPTTFSCVNRICESLGQPIPLPLESVIGMYRYHVHQDNPEKAQYSDSDREFLNGFDIHSYVELTKKEIRDMKIQITQYINSQDIVEYSTLVDFLIENEQFELADVAMCNTLYFDRYIASRKFRNSAANGGRY